MPRSGRPALLLPLRGLSDKKAGPKGGPKGRLASLPEGAREGQRKTIYREKAPLGNISQRAESFGHI